MKRKDLQVFFLIDGSTSKLLSPTDKILMEIFYDNCSVFFRSDSEYRAYFVELTYFTKKN